MLERIYNKNRIFKMDSGCNLSNLKFTRDWCSFYDDGELRDIWHKELGKLNSMALVQ